MGILCRTLSLIPSSNRSLQLLEQGTSGPGHCRVTWHQLRSPAKQQVTLLWLPAARHSQHLLGLRMAVDRFMHHFWKYHALSCDCQTLSEVSRFRVYVLVGYCAVLTMQPDLHRAAGMAARRKLRAPPTSMVFSVQSDVSDQAQMHYYDRGLYFLCWQQHNRATV